MSRSGRLFAAIVTVLIMVAVIAFTVVRIGQVVGWSGATSAWPVLLILVVLIVMIGWFIFLGIRSRLNR